MFEGDDLWIICMLSYQGHFMLASKEIFHLRKIKKFSLHTLCLLNSSYNLLYHKPPFFFRKAKGKKSIWDTLLLGKYLP